MCHTLREQPHEDLRVLGGPEFTSTTLEDRYQQRGIFRMYIVPGKPDKNAFISRLNRTYRSVVLDAHLFESIEQVQLLTNDWLTGYNHEHPHESLGRVAPLMFMPRQTSGASGNPVST